MDRRLNARYADIPDGAPDQVVHGAIEITRTLYFDDSGIESE